MTGQEIAFGVLAVVGGAGALLVVTSRNVVHAALYLVVALASVAGAYLVMAAPFVAFVQVIIYVGAIVVLLLFGIMLTRAPVGRRVLDNTRRARYGAAIVAGLVFAMLTWFMARAFSGERLAPGAPTTLEALGGSIFRDFVLPFEAVSVLLLAALIGAIVLSRRDVADDAGADAGEAASRQAGTRPPAGRSPDQGSDQGPDERVDEPAGR